MRGRVNAKRGSRLLQCFPIEGQPALFPSVRAIVHASPAGREAATSRLISLCEYLLFAPKEFAGAVADNSR